MLGVEVEISASGRDAERMAIAMRAVVVALGAARADPIIGLAIALLILHITWRSWWTVRRGAGNHEEPEKAVAPDENSR